MVRHRPTPGRARRLRPTESRTPARHAGGRLLPLLLAALVALAFLDALPGGFVLDDHHLVEQNPAVRSLAGLQRAFTTDYDEFHSGRPGRSYYYRPIAAASYLVDHTLWGQEPGPYHLQNLLWHLAAALLAYALVLRLTGAPWVAFGASALWALHPIASESVAWISGRTDPMAAALGLGALLAYLRSAERRALWLPVACILLYLALMAKEVAAVVPFLAVSAGAIARPAVARPWRRWILDLGVLALPLLLYLLQRQAVLAHAGTVVPADGGWDGRLAVFLRACAFYGMSFAWPVHLAGDIHVRSAAWSEPAVWAGLSLLAGWAVLFAWSLRRRPALAFGLGWAMLTLLPASGLLLPTAIPVAVRFLYLPSLGLTLALMLLVRPAVEARLRTEWPRVAVILPLVLVLGALTARRNLEYRDDAAFYTSLIRNADRPGFGVEPGISSLVNYATLVGKQGRLDEAETLTRRAIGEEPRSAMAWNNLGIVRALRRDLAASLAAFREASRLDPGDAKTRFNVALTLDQMGRGAEALTAYRTASSLPLDEETRRQTSERLRALAADTSATLRAPAAAR